jgi:hypothetical protein
VRAAGARHMGQTQSMEEKPLCGCVVKVVDGRGNVDFDAAGPLERCLRQLGAQTRVSFVKNLTHVVVVQRHDDPDSDLCISALHEKAQKVWHGHLL